MSTYRPIVIIESPYAGDVVTNVAYARKCIRDSIDRGESPFASHLLYTQPGVLDDSVHGERELGLAAGWEFYRVADYVAIYTDLGTSEGMIRGAARGVRAGITVKRRQIGA